MSVFHLFMSPEGQTLLPPPFPLFSSFSLISYLLYHRILAHSNIDLPFSSSLKLASARSFAAVSCLNQKAATLTSPLNKGSLYENRCLGVVCA